MPSITKRSIDAIAPTGVEQFIWDTELRGFALRVMPSGVRTYMVQYRNRYGVSRRLALGRHGVITPEQARKRAREILAEVTRGEDPAAARKKARNAVNVAELCDRYLKEHVTIFNRLRSAREYRRLVERHIKPTLGVMKAEAVRREDIMRFHYALRRTPRQANQALAVLSKMFNLAEAWGLRSQDTNPCRHVKRYPENKRERFLSDAELKAVGQVLAASEADGSQMSGVIAAIRLLALTGCRAGEILSLRWEDVDLEAGALSLPRAKAGARVHTIGAQAVALLAGLPRVPGNPWVIHSKKPMQPLRIDTLDGAWARIRARATLINWCEGDLNVAGLVTRLARELNREPTIDECKLASKEAGIKLPVGLMDARIHDLRHTVGTYAGQTGANAFNIRDLLGHKTLTMTGRYVNRDTNPLRELSNAVGSRIAAAMKGSEGQILNLDARRKKQRAHP